MPAPKVNAGEGGRKGPSNDKIWRDAIMRAVHRAANGEKTKRLEQLADQLVARGISGDVPALKEIGDRLDGRPSQAIEHGGKDGGDLIVKIVQYGGSNPPE